MDFLSSMTNNSDQMISLSAQPSPSASSLHATSLDHPSALSAPSTPTGVTDIGLLAGLVAGSSSATTASGDDKEERPSLSYKDLIIEAIESVPDKRLKLSEIYQVSFFF
uniref:Fork-head domain-containing protein n=1 Tax=Panagrolaimus sp. PS1159 TaxID=55785 RepID=A0AC35F1R2_9BILA